MPAWVAMIAYTCYLRDPRVRREAEALVEAGYPVTVLALRERGEASREVVHGVEVVRAPLHRLRNGPLGYVLRYTLFFLMAFGWLTLLAWRRRPRVVYVHNLPNFLVFAALVPRLLGARVVLDIHDPVPEFYRCKYGVAASSWMVRLLRLEERLSTRFAHHVVTVNEPVAQVLRQRGVPAGKLTVVMNAPDARLFAAPCSGAPPPNGDLPLLYAGTVAPRYGLDVALRGLALVRRRHPEVRLRVVGEGDGLPALRALARELGLEGAVEFHPPVPLEQVPQLIAEARVGLSPQRDDPFMGLAFSTKVLEFLSMGLPVVCARTRCMEHYFGGDGLVCFFRPGDPEDFARGVEEALARRDQAEVRRLGVERFLERYGWEVQRARYLRLVAHLAGEPQAVEVGQHASMD